MSKWEEIPGHLLEFIVEKGLDFEDIVALALVCKSWRDVAAKYRETFAKAQTQRLPWLMLPPQKGSPLRGFYSLARRKIYQIQSRRYNGKKCYSSRGWLLTVGSDWGMNLMHPFSRAAFKLPGIKSFSLCRYVNLQKPYVRFISRFILTATPSPTSDFVVMVLQGYPSMPAYWRPGDKRWTLIESKETAFADAVFDGDKCYFITFTRKFLVTDFGTPNPTTTTFITEFPEELIAGGMFEALYLVIIRGNLLLVSREGQEDYRPEKEFREKPYLTRYFQVFKLDFKSLRWKELPFLGNWSLFLGHNSSMALHAPSVKGCKRNSIYFTDDDTCVSHSTRAGAGFDMGIFSMETKTIEPITEGEWRNRVSPPIFVDPTFSEY